MIDPIAHDWSTVLDSLYVQSSEIILNAEVCFTVTDTNLNCDLIQNVKSSLILLVA